MSDASAPPEWLENWRRQGSPPRTSPAEPPRQGPDGRFLPGRSGNPAGRPKGSVDKKQKLQQAFADEAHEIVRVVIDKALDGDMQAASICLARLSPPLKAVAERVQFDFRTDVPLSEQAASVMAAVAAGAVDPETGKLLIGMIQALGSLRAVEDLEQRIIQLEAKQIG